MASWGEIELAAPELAAQARELLDAHVHKTIATLRRDGSPRISGIEAKLIDGDLWSGSMPGALKVADLRRDPRFALHSGSDDPPGWRGDAKASGRAEEVWDERRQRAFEAWGGDADDIDSESSMFRLDVEELAVTRPNEAGDALVIDYWNAEAGLRQLSRR